MPKIDEQIAVVARKIEQNRNRLKDLKGRATKQDRKDDARRKLLYGAAYLAALPSLSTDAQKRSLERVEACITRPKDREFLGLEPLKDTNSHSKISKDADKAVTADLPFASSPTSE
ncbi:hypothetical protein JSE7799_02676 [Jannaschia seosinensis]|uniref:Conjugal transfer protein TraD n=1 Tax=Jannaschia seosinensis TaxID=313367 RepID=A0A0M7BCZ7_9RHOB|nr:hypothetical protein [Jannaschia seosinensis]CUH39948.1 hypothetical protein JSE7799_02676 [Jannaschia seosinensis]